MMENEGDVGKMIELVQYNVLHQGIVGVMPEFHAPIVYLRRFLGMKDPADAILGEANAQIVKYRKLDLVEKEDPRSNPFILKLVKLEKAGKVNYWDMMNSMGGNIAAGSDTTAITLSAILYYLYRAPRVLAVLRKEIDDMAAAGKISDPITFQEAQDMPYLQAVIKEGLRIHPAVGYLLPRRVPKGGVELAGRHFPEGASVSSFFRAELC